MPDAAIAGPPVGSPERHASATGAIPAFLKPCCRPSSSSAAAIDADHPGVVIGPAFSAQTAA